MIYAFQISDLRELHYEKMGIGSSYLFRIDSETVVSNMLCLNGKLILCLNVKQMFHG